MKLRFRSGRNRYPRHIFIFKKNHLDLWEEKKRDIAAGLLWHQKDDRKYDLVRRFSRAIDELDFLQDRLDPQVHLLKSGINSLLHEILPEELSPDEAPLLCGALEAMTSDKFSAVVDHLKTRHPDIWQEERRLISLPPPRGIHAGYYAHETKVSESSSRIAVF